MQNNFYTGEGLLYENYRRGLEKMSNDVITIYRTTTITTTTTVIYEDDDDELKKLFIKVV